MHHRFGLYDAGQTDGTKRRPIFAAGDADELLAAMGAQRARLTLPCARRKARSLHEPDDGLTQRRICRFAVVGESIGWYAPCLSRTGNENNHPPRVAAVASGMFPKPRRGAFDIHNARTCGIRRSRPVAALALMWAQTPMPSVVCRWSMKGSQAPCLHTSRALS